jgi:hypothetical protein
LVEDGDGADVEGRSPSYGGGPDVDVGVVGRQAHPVLQAVHRRGHLCGGLDQEDARHLGGRQSITSFGLLGPPHEDDIHA